MDLSCRKLFVLRCLAHIVVGALLPYLCGKPRLSYDSSQLAVWFETSDVYSLTGHSISPEPGRLNMRPAIKPVRLLRPPAALSRFVFVSSQAGRALGAKTRPAGR